jgi:hypothetical protein
MFARRRPLLRAAVVGGGAFVAGRAAANRSAERADQDARISDLESQQQPQAAPEAAPAVPAQGAGQPPADSSVFSQLSELVQMHDRGALTDEEFSAAKAQLLG